MAAGRTALTPLTSVAPPRRDALPPRARVLTDGRIVILRQLRASDVDEVREMLSRCSPESLGRRFLSPVPRIAEAWLRQLVDVDNGHLDAVAATAGRSIVGIAHLGRMRRSGSAEVAALVEDGWQERGLGRLLLRFVVDLAGRRGVDAITGYTDRNNERALRLLRGLPNATVRAEGPLLAFRAPIGPPKVAHTA